MENLDPELLLRKAQALGDDIKEIESIDAAHAYEQARFRIRANQKKQMYSRLSKYAAFLTLPLLFTSLVLGYLYFHEPEPNEKYAEVVAASGSVIRYELPDNSVVWLNAGSSLRYPAVFRKDRRSVELKGEAYFEVQADSKHPFYVNTADGLSVLVYGTTFNVAAYEDENLIGVVLETGKVNVITPNKESITLLPGEQFLFDKQSHKLAKNGVDVYEKVAWKDGKLLFRNATLEDIFKRLERHFNVEIEFDHKPNKEYKYRATFRNETLSQILDYLSKSAVLKWEIKDAEQQIDATFTKKKITITLD